MKTEKTGRVARKREIAFRNFVEAGYRLVAEKGVQATSIQEVVDLADHSVGAFYSHFKNKQVFIEAMVNQIVEPVARAIDAYAVDAEDHITPFAVGHKLTLLLAQQDRQWGQFVIATTAEYPDAPNGLKRTLDRDIQRGIKNGDFEVKSMEAAIALAGGTQLIGVSTAGFGEVAEDFASQITFHVLRGLGVHKAKAEKVAYAPLPTLDVQSEFIKWR